MPSGSQLTAPTQRRVQDQLLERLAGRVRNRDVGANRREYVVGQRVTRLHHCIGDDDVLGMAELELPAGSTARLVAQGGRLVSEIDQVRAAGGRTERRQTTIDGLCALGCCSPEYDQASSSGCSDPIFSRAGCGWLSFQAATRAGPVNERPSIP